MDFTKHIEKRLTEYQNWVRSNPTLMSDVESGLRYLSYIIASRFENSNLMSELVYSSYKLLVFFNDRIIFNGLAVPSVPNPYRNKLKKWLTIIDHCQVLIELSAERRWRSRGKWTIVLVIQLIKSIIRLYLLLGKKEQIVEPYPIGPLDRKNLSSYVCGTIKNKKDDGIVLKNGRVIRPLDEGSSTKRDWKPINRNSMYAKEDKQLSTLQVQGEVIYICKPLAHLAGIYFSGPNSWKPWLLSLTLDIISLQLVLRSNTKSTTEDHLSRRQRLEMTRRTMALTWYLMRSPFYDVKTKGQILAVLERLARLPLVGVFCRSIVEYLPLWQQTYFYTWSS